MMGGLLADDQLSKDQSGHPENGQPRVAGQHVLLTQVTSTPKLLLWLGELALKFWHPDPLQNYSPLTPNPETLDPTPRNPWPTPRARPDVLQLKALASNVANTCARRNCVGLWDTNCL